MRIHFRPQTLFRVSHWETYLMEAQEAGSESESLGDPGDPLRNFLKRQEEKKNGKKNV